MSINVRTNISNEYKDIEVCINAPERNELVERLEKELSYVNSETLSQVVGIQNNDLYILLHDVDLRCQVPAKPVADQGCFPYQRCLRLFQAHLHLHRK